MKPIRRGMSLIETQVVIAISAILISGTGMCLHGVYRAQHRLQGNLQRQASLDRLILQFRADVHAADDAILNGPVNGSLKLVLSGTSEVLYEANATGVSRSLVVDGTVAHRDAFHLPGAAPATWMIRGEQVVSMRIASSDERTDGSQLAALTVEATINLHQLSIGDRIEPVFGWLGSKCEERVLSPQDVAIWGLAALDPSHSPPQDSGSIFVPILNAVDNNDA